jgi:hypothetical protein
MCIAGCSSSGDGGTEQCFLGTAQASGRNRSDLARMISRPLLDIILGLGLQPCKCVLQVAIGVVQSGATEVSSRNRSDRNVTHLCTNIAL